MANRENASIVQELCTLMPSYFPGGERRQMIVCSATLHNFEVKRLAVSPLSLFLSASPNPCHEKNLFHLQDQNMHFPQWVDLKGADVVPETVHQVTVWVDPRDDKSWIRLRSKPGETARVGVVYLFNLWIALYLHHSSFRPMGFTSTIPFVRAAKRPRRSPRR